MRDRYQGGSLAGFIIIGVLLALVLVGGLYGLNRYNAQKMTNEQVASTSQKEDEQKESSKDQQTAKLDDKAAEERAESQTKVTAPRTSQETTQETAQKPATSTPAASSQTPTSTHLPQTGPADVVLTLVALSALVFAGAYYLRSLA